VSSDVYNSRCRDAVKLVNGEIKPQFPSPNVCITTDIRASKRFRVSDYDETIVKDLVNGDDVMRWFGSAYALLMGYYESCNLGNGFENLDPDRGPYLQRKPHGSDFSVETAIRKMFLLQIPVDKKEEGRLVVGDIDHVVMFM